MSPRQRAADFMRDSAVPRAAPDAQAGGVRVSELFASQWNDQVRVTSFSPALVTEVVPGQYASFNAFFWQYAFGARHDWVSFQGVVAGTDTTPAAWFRWFSVLHGTTPQPVQKFPTTIGSSPSESPDHSRVALLSDQDLEVTTLDHGTFTAPRALLPLSRAELLSVSALSWSVDSTRIITVTSTSNSSSDYLLRVVDTTPDPPEAIAVPTFNGAYALQP